MLPPYSTHVVPGTEMKRGVWEGSGRTPCNAALGLQLPPAWQTPGTIIRGDNQSRNCESCFPQRCQPSSSFPKSWAWRQWIISHFFWNSHFHHCKCLRAAIIKMLAESMTQGSRIPDQNFYPTWWKSSSVSSFMNLEIQILIAKTCAHVYVCVVCLSRKKKKKTPNNFE